MDKISVKSPIYESTVYLEGKIDLKKNSSFTEKQTRSYDPARYHKIWEFLEFIKHIYLLSENVFFYIAW